MLTVRELAESLGKSKPAIMKRIDELGLRSQLIREGNRFNVPSDVVEAVTRSYEVKERARASTSKGIDDGKLHETLEERIKELTEHLRVLSLELENKQSTIDRLLDQLEQKEITNRETVRAVQAGFLVASTSETTDAEEHQEQEQDKRGLFGRLFR